MRRSRSLCALLAGIAITVSTACSGPATDRDAASDAPTPTCETPAPLEMGPCDDGYFLYDDPICGPWPPDAGPPMCGEAGDGRCHQECRTDADCTDPCRPLCRRLGLFNGGDFNCNRVITICRAEDIDHCVW